MARGSTIGVIAVVTLALGTMWYTSRESGSLAVSSSAGTASAVVVKAPGSLAGLETCKWTFVQYKRGKLEQQWIDNVNKYQDQVCETTKQLDETFKAWLEYTSSHLLHNNVTLNCTGVAEHPNYLPLPLADITNNSHSKIPLVPDVFSTFEYAWTCKSAAGAEVRTHVPNIVVPIDPLAGPLRDYRICTEHGKYEPSKDYLLVDPWQLHNVGREFRVRSGESPLDRKTELLPVGTSKFFVFDVGSSTWTSGAGGASMPFFTGIVENRCGKVEGFYAWEGERSEPRWVLTRWLLMACVLFFKPPILPLPPWLALHWTGCCRGQLFVCLHFVCVRYDWSLGGRSVRNSRMALRLCV